MIVKNQMNLYISASRLLSDCQSGFRKHHSTETALLQVTDDLICMLDDKKTAILALLDFSKAFDSVNHNLLLFKLQNNFKFSSSAISLISSYLNLRQQFVCVNGISSNMTTVSTGVPQGSILGPLLFSLFINDLPTVLQHCRCVMFADDVQIYLGGKNYAIRQVANALNEDLSSIGRWAFNNSLKLNPKKSVCVLFSNRNREALIRDLVPIQLNGEVIDITPSAKNLGVFMDSSFTWVNQINSVCGKIYAGLRSLWTSAGHASENLRARLVKSLILPHFMYCSSVVGRLSGIAFNKLQRSYNACLRYIYRIPRYVSVSRYSYTFIGCSLQSFLKYRLCYSIHKLIAKKHPKPLYEKLTHGTSGRLNRIVIPRNRTSLKNKSYFVYGPSLYNSLPSDIKTAPLTKFKNAAFHHFCSADRR